MNADHHTHIHSEAFTPPELSDFARTAETLFSIVDTATTDTQFYTVQWQDTVTPKLADVLVHNFQSTGARRLELHRNTFGEAQFIVTSSSLATGEITEVFRWCKTEPLPPSEPADPQIDALENDFGYKRVTPENIIGTLTSRALTFEDQNVLLEYLNDRGLRVNSELSTLLSTQVYRSIGHVLDTQSNDLTSAIRRDQVYGMIRMLDRVNPDVAVRLQSQLVSRLLKTASSASNQSRQSGSSQRQAMEMLEGAFERGVLPHVRRVLDRVFANEIIFRSDYMTELLFGELVSRRYSDQTKNIYRVSREAFAHDFIVNTIAGRLQKYPELRDTNPEMASAIEALDLRTTQYLTPPISFDDIFALAKSFGFQGLLPPPTGYASDVPAEKGKATKHHSAHEFADFELVGKAYADILAHLRSAIPGAHPDQEELDAHCVEIVRIATLPYQWRKLLRGIVRVDDKDSTSAQAEELLDEMDDTL